MNRIIKIILKEKECYLYDFILIRPMKINNNITTIAINQKGTINYNEDFLSRLSDKETIAVLYHEILHLVYEHTQSKKTNHYLLNIAGDIYINEELKEINYNLPKGTLFRDSFNVPDSCDTAESIYNYLDKNLSQKQKQELQKINEQILENQDILESESKQESESKEESDSEESELNNIKSMIKQDLQNKLFKSHKIQEVAPVEWNIDIQTQIGRLIKRIEERNYLRPPRVQIKGLLRPNYRKNILVPKINVYIDKSGSMDKDLPVIISSLLKIKQKLKNYIPTYYLFDTEIKEIQESELVNVEASGGTEFKKLKPNADMHIIITDGALDFNYLDSQPNTLIYIIKDNVIFKRIKEVK